MVKFYKDFIRRNPVAAECAKMVELQRLSRDDVARCVQDTAMSCAREGQFNLDTEQIVKYVLDRYNYLMK